MVKNGRTKLSCSVTIAAVLLAAYAALMVAIGILGLARVRTAEDYLVAGRRGRGLHVGGSLAATILGASATLGLAGLAYRRGLTGSWWLLVGALGLTALLFLVRRARAHPVYSLPGLIGHWYGPVMRRVAAAFIAVAWLGIVGAQVSASGRILAAFLGGRLRALGPGRRGPVRPVHGPGRAGLRDRHRPAAAACSSSSGWPAARCSGCAPRGASAACGRPWTPASSPFRFPRTSRPWTWRCWPWWRAAPT